MGDLSWFRRQQIEGKAGRRARTPQHKPGSGRSSTGLMDKDPQAGRGDFMPVFSTPAAYTALGWSRQLIPPQPTAADMVHPQGWRWPRSHRSDGNTALCEPRVVPMFPCSRGVSVPGELSSARSSLPRSALAGPWERSPSESPGSWGAPWGPPYLFKPLARERQSTARRRRCFMSAAALASAGLCGCGQRRGVVLIPTGTPSPRCTSARDNAPFSVNTGLWRWK